MRYAWKYCKRLEPGGLRLFWEATTDRVAVADNSGRTPEETEDGVQWIDQDAPARVYYEGKGRDRNLYILLPLQGGGFSVVGLEGAKVLLEAMPQMRFSIDERVKEDHQTLTGLMLAECVVEELNAGVAP